MSLQVASPQRERAVNLYLQGLSINEIERKSGVLRKELYKDLHKNGIQVGRRPNTNGKHAPDAASALAAVTNTIDAEIAKAQEMQQKATARIEELTKLKALLATLG